MPKTTLITALMLLFSSAVCAGSSNSPLIPVSLTLSGSANIDISATTGTFPDAVTGVGQNASLTTQVNITSPANMPYTLGVNAGQHAVSGVRHLVDGLNTPISYSISHYGVVFGDANIDNFDSSYVPTSPENALALTGTGLVQPVTVEFVAVVPANQAAGVYSDSVV